MTGLNNRINLINTLVEKTNNTQINWKSIHSLRNSKNLERQNPGAYYLIFENEYHHVFDDSYYADIHIGNIYLLHEEFESGKDGSVSNLYNLYIQERDANNCMNKTQPILVSDKDCNLDGLIKAINKCINKEDTIIEKFLNKLNNYFQ